MTIPVDNQIIDFNTLNNIYTTLASHEDVFNSLETKAIVATSDNIAGTATALNVSSMKIATIRTSVTSTQVTTGIPLGVSFQSTPTIVATCEYAGTSGTSFVAQITANGSNGTYGTVDIYVYDAAGKVKTPTSVTINIIAIGQAS